MTGEYPLLVHEDESARRLFASSSSLFSSSRTRSADTLSSSAAVLPHIRARLFLDREIEPRHELNAPQNPQRILEERVSRG